MTKVWRFIRRWWWVFVAVAAGLFLVAWRLMAKPGGSDQPVPPQVPTLAERARQEVERVRLEGEVEKARAKAAADAQRAEIARIEELGESQPAEARRQLADWLQRHF